MCDDVLMDLIYRKKINVRIYCNINNFIMYEWCIFINLLLFLQKAPYCRFSEEFYVKWVKYDSYVPL